MVPLPPSPNIIMIIITVLELATCYTGAHATVGHAISMTYAESAKEMAQSVPDPS